MDTLYKNTTENIINNISKKRHISPGPWIEHLHD